MFRGVIAFQRNFCSVFDTIIKFLSLSPWKLVIPRIVSWIRSVLINDEAVCPNTTGDQILSLYVGVSLLMVYCYNQLLMIFVNGKNRTKSVVQNRTFCYASMLYLEATNDPHAAA